MKKSPGGFILSVGLMILVTCWEPAGAAAQGQGQGQDHAQASGRFELGLLVLPGLDPVSWEISRFTLRRIAEIQGLPYRFIESPEAMARYPLIILAQAPSNRELDTRWQEALYGYVEDGGVLFVPGKPGSELFSLLGITAIESVKTRTRLEFTGDDPSFAYIDHSREKTISLGNGEKKVYPEVIWSHGASTDFMAEVLARFDDGSAGMLRNYYGRGVAYFLGLSFEETVLLPQTGGDYEAQRTFVNTVEPSADTVMLLVKALYEDAVPRAVYLSPIPEARPTALLLSHDVDAQTSFVDSLKFAALEEDFGAKATFFINTKYFENWMDIAYYSVPENVEAVRRLFRRGHEIGSHTVAHALDFDSAPPGSPDVNFNNYNPQEGLTINGEVRVSKELLDRDMPGQDTVSFRAGYLAFPPELISILEQAGYKYDSSFSANDVLTTFPYFALPQRRPGAVESEVIEIPVTLDEAVGYLTLDRGEIAVEQWKKVVKAHADNESITVLLIHPSDTRDQDYKLEAQRSLMEYARGLDAWMGSIGDFGDFWRARHELKITGVRVFDAVDAGMLSTGGALGTAGVLEIRLSLPRTAIHPMIGFVIPGADRYGEVRVFDAAGKVLPVDRREAGGKLFLNIRK